MNQKSLEVFSLAFERDSNLQADQLLIDHGGAQPIKQASLVDL